MKYSEEYFVQNEGYFVHVGIAGHFPLEFDLKSLKKVKTKENPKT
jgi:hypothetical protein